MLYILHPRQAVIDNVNKMIHCGDSSYGGAMYHCPDCNEWKFVPFRCHSCFCPTCGNMYSIDRTTSMSFKLLSCTHRHCVFTIPEQLRSFFYRIIPYSIVCFLLFAVLFSICSTNRTNPNSSLLALSPFFILLDAILNGIHIFTVLSLKVVSAMITFGVK